MYAQFKPTRDGDYNAYICKSYRTKKGGTSSETVEKLGLLSKIAKEHPDMDPRDWVRERAAMLTEQEKKETVIVSVKLSPKRRIPKGKGRSFYGGDLFLMEFYHKLEIDRICGEISRRYKFKFNLDEIFSKLIYGRILFPDSKRATYNAAKSFIDTPRFELEDVYKSLSILARESDFIQSALYHNSQKTGKRDTRVIYYDCTNYYFEIEQEDELRKYGHSKEHRPNPIVQMGMFMDAEGLPLAFCVNPGNTAETQTLRPLEEKLADNFSLSDFVVCTDGGLGCLENRMYNQTEGRDYITVLSLKKMRAHLQDWILDPEEKWFYAGCQEGIKLKDAYEKFDKETLKTMTFYRDRWTNEEYKLSNGQKVRLEEHLIVTYSPKYAMYQRQKRDEQIARARLRIERGESSQPKSPNDCRRLIKPVSVTEQGELAEITEYKLDTGRIKSEERFDGFYAYGTSLNDDPLHVLKANSFRADIEALFRVTKTNMDLRPIYLSDPEHIKGHFIMCFTALLILKQLQFSLSSHCSIDQLCDTLREIKFLYHDAYGYEPEFTPSDITDELQRNANILIDTEIVPKATMRRFIRSLKKR